MAKKSKKEPSKNVAKAKGKTAAKTSRPYPRASLEDALRIPYALKEKNGGNAWSPDEVAKRAALWPESIRVQIFSVALTSSCTCPASTLQNRRRIWR